MAAFTFTSILTEVRGAITDANGIRWTDAVLRDFAFAGETHIVARHPESQYITRVANSTPVLLTANGQSFTINDTFRNALIHFIAFRALNDDADDDANHKLAQDHFNHFVEAMR